MKRDIYKHASLKLASIYVSIIVCISLIFSFWLYRITFNQVKHGIYRPPGPIEQILRQENSRFAEELRAAQEAAIQDAREHLIIQFVTLNIIIAVSGGLGSYYLARRTLQPIEAAHVAQSRFAADASHELRTPITAMRIENEVTLSDPSLNLKEAKEQLQSNIEELDTLMNLTENLLTMARLGSEPLETEPIKMKEVLERAIAKVHTHAQQKHQIIKLEKVPKRSLQAHKSLLPEAFVTLLDNAIKYSPERSTILVKTHIEHKQIRVDIIDEGSGISPNDLPHIFKRFYRADSSRTKNVETKGFGLGLSIAQAIVHAHHGSISARNVDNGKGACFTVQLPLS